VRCLDSFTLASCSLGQWAKGNEQVAKCGNCGRPVPTVVLPVDPNRLVRLAVHGDRTPCPQCRSRSPRHHISDHADG